RIRRDFWNISQFLSVLRFLLANPIRSARQNALRRICLRTLLSVFLPLDCQPQAKTAPKRKSLPQRFLTHCLSHTYGCPSETHLYILCRILPPWHGTPLRLKQHGKNRDLSAFRFHTKSLRSIA